MEETPRRRLTDTSSLIEISTDQLGNNVVVREESLSLPTVGVWTYIKDDVNGFSPSRIFDSWRKFYERAVLLVSSITFPLISPFLRLQ
jgi:hypothetical protein